MFMNGLSSVICTIAEAMMSSLIPAAVNAVSLSGDKMSLPPGEVTENHQSWHPLQTKGGDVVLEPLVSI